MTNIENYIKNAYKWNISNCVKIPTKYKTNNNFKFKHDGEFYFLKIYSSYKSFKKEVLALKMLGELACVPQIIAFYDSYGNGYSSIIQPFYSEYIPLKESIIQNSNAIAYNIGKNLKTIHNHLIKRCDNFGSLDKEFEFSNYQDFVRFKIMNIDCEKDPILRTTVDDLEKEIGIYSNRIIIPHILHNDLNPDNILYREKDGRLMFIDFERSYMGHYIMDFPKLFWRCFNYNESRILSFFQGYDIEEFCRKELEFSNKLFLLELLNYLIAKEDCSDIDIETIAKIKALLNNEVNVYGSRNRSSYPLK